MAPTITVDAADPTQVDGASTPATFAPLAPLSQPIQLPAADLLRQLLTEQLHAGVAAAREQRGPIHEPDQVNPLIRTLQDVRNNLQVLVDALLAVLALVDAEQLAEVVVAVGPDTNGFPRKNYAVPYNGEKIKFIRETEGEYETDLGQLIAATRTLVETNWRRDGDDPEAEWQEFADELCRVVLDDLMRKTQPKTTGVEAVAVSLAHAGDDGAASIARSAHRKVGTTVKRVKIEQVNPIQEAARPPVIGRRR